jgi:hypothetical protein
VRANCVAAANKHSVVVTAGGEVYTWGGNALGQLGYGTSDCTSNPTPRLVEAMKGRRLVAVAAAKRHTGGCGGREEQGHGPLYRSKCLQGRQPLHTMTCNTHLTRCALRSIYGSAQTNRHDCSPLMLPWLLLLPQWC